MSDIQKLDVGLEGQLEDALGKIGLIIENNVITDNTYTTSRNPPILGFIGRPI